MLIIFGRNVTEKMRSQKVPHFPTSPTQYFCTTWQNAKTRKSHLFTQMLTALPDFQQVVGLIYLVLLLATHACAVV